MEVIEMTRNEAKQNLINLGIEEPTDEQISTYLNSVNGETQKYKEDAGKLKDVQKELDDLKNANLTDIEKANKAVEDANKRIAELEAKEALGNQRNNAMSKFKITAEQAQEVIKDDGSFDFDALGKIISEKEAASANAKEQELANGSSNPGGGSAGGNAPEKTEAEKLAENLYSKTDSDGANSVLDHYL